MRIAWLVLVAGCWTGSEPRHATSPEAATVAREPFPLASKWKGRYRCSQGWTAMYLELTATPDGKLTAIFEFGPTLEDPAANPTATATATGAYRMAGTIRPHREGTFAVALDPVEWIMAPDGYIMVSLQAVSSRKWQRLTGTIKNPACGDLDVRRAD